MLSEAFSAFTFHPALHHSSSPSRPTLISDGCEGAENKARELQIDVRAALSIDWLNAGPLNLPNN